MKKTQKYALQFAERLRRVMKERNLRQTDVCKLIEPYCEKYGVCINKSHLSQYLSGNFYPALFNFSILCMALDVPMEWLCWIDDIAESEKNQELRGFKSLEKRVADIEKKLKRLLPEEETSECISKGVQATIGKEIEIITTGTINTGKWWEGQATDGN